MRVDPFPDFISFDLKLSLRTYDFNNLLWSKIAFIPKGYDISWINFRLFPLYNHIKRCSYQLENILKANSNVFTGAQSVIKFCGTI